MQTDRQRVRDQYRDENNSRAASILGYSVNLTMPKICRFDEEESKISRVSTEETNGSETF